MKSFFFIFTDLKRADVDSVPFNANPSISLLYTGPLGVFFFHIKSHEQTPLQAAYATKQV